MPSLVWEWGTEQEADFPVVEIFLEPSSLSDTVGCVV